jgi:hypothetical protein
MLIATQGLVRREPTTQESFLSRFEVGLEIVHRPNELVLRSFSIAEDGRDLLFLSLILIGGTIMEYIIDFHRIPIKRGISTGVSTWRRL